MVAACCSTATGALNMAIDANAVTWDAPAAQGSIDPSAVQWDEPPAPVGAVQGLVAGLGRGAKDVIDTGAQFLASGFDKIAGTREGERVAAINKAGTDQFTQDYAGSTAADIGRVGGQIAATLPVGGALGAGVKAVGAAGLAPRALVPLGEAVASGGMRAGTAGPITRALGGAINGGATAGLVDPDNAAAGAAVGAAVPAVVRGAGQAFNKLGLAIRGPEVPEGIRRAAVAGAEEGLVVPPSMVRPTLGNRVLEGYAGKIAVAQGASEKNQRLISQVARRSIGAEDLSPEGLAAVRTKANQAYDALGRAGRFETDDAYRKSLADIGVGSKKFKADFPELIGKDAEKLVRNFSQKQGFDAQAGIEAIKRLRASASANRAAFNDPDKLALGRVQSKLSAALEDLIDRNLSKRGNADLLGSYRGARQTLARVYDVEKALNPATGEIDARKLLSALKKGRLSGELKSVAEFAAAFPKAVQPVEQIGSRPGLSPLDFGYALGGSAAVGPAALLHLAARPAARMAALSPSVQRSLAKPPSQAGLGLIGQSEGDAAQRLARIAPVALTGSGP